MQQNAQLLIILRAEVLEVKQLGRQALLIKQQAEVLPGVPEKVIVHEAEVQKYSKYSF